MSDKILIKAWTSLDAGPILDALATACIEFFQQHNGLIHNNDIVKEQTDLFDDSEKRRLLAAKVVELSQEWTIRFELTSYSPRLIRAEDFDWCVGQLCKSVGGTTELIWAQLVWTPFGQPDSHQLDLLIKARKQSPLLRAESELFFTPIALDSERAQKMKKDYRDAQKCNRKPRKRRVKPSPSERIKHSLGRSEKGEANSWWVLLGDMTLEDTSTHYGIVPLDVRKLPGWQHADASIRQRMLAAADRFLRHGSVDPLKWLREPHRWGRFDIAAYAALFLLKNEAPATYNALPGWVFERHVATVLCAPFFDGEDGQESQHEEVALRCYQQAKSAVMFYLPVQIDAEDRDKGNRHISCDRKLGQCWDEGLKRAIHEKLIEAQGYWQTATFDHVAELLLIQGHQPTRELLVGIVRSVTEETCGNLEQARLAASGLISHSSDAAWSIIWRAVLANREFGRKLLMSVAHGLHHNAGKVGTKLTDDQLGDLFVWLVKEFPYSQDREHDGWNSPDMDDSARDFRDEVLSFLESRGTPASVQAIQRAAESLPELDSLRSTVVEARRNALRRTWKPCTPADFLQVATQPDARLVRNAEELQEVLISAIRRLEVKLQGETPAAPDLWDQTDRTRGHEKFRPKDENHLSDWIKRHLEDARKDLGIVVAREVQIRRGEGEGKGETTDIHVTAVVPGLAEGSLDKVRVIIEAKGCWHSELKTAMKTQLVGRYLKDNQCQHGIYVVGWYMCPQWDDADYRKGDVPRWTLAEAKTNFDKQAEDLSKGGLSIRSVVVNTALR